MVRRWKVPCYGCTKLRSVARNSSRVFSYDSERIFAARSFDSECGFNSALLCCDLIFRGETEHRVPSDPVSSVGRAFPPFASWWEFCKSSLISDPVISQGHPFLLELLRCHSRSVVPYGEQAARFVGQDDFDLGRSGVPRIRNELCECDFGRIGYGSQCPTEKILFK